MGIAAFLGGLGQAAQQSNLQQAQLDHDANEHMAQAMETLASTAKPEYQPDYLQLAAKYRMLKPGQKPGKDMDPRAVMIRQLSTSQQAKQLADAHEGEVQRRVGEVVGQQPGPAQQGQGGGQGAHGGQPSLPPPPAGMAGLPDQSAQPQSLPAVPGATPGVTAPDGSQVPNTPSGGFSNGQLPPPPSASPGGQVFTQYTPQERIQMQAAADQAKYGAQNSAELERAKQLATFQRTQRQQVVTDLKASGVKLSPRIEAQILSGQSIAPDRAPIKIPGQVQGETAPPGTVDAFGKPVGKGLYDVMQNPEDGQFTWTPAVSATTKSVQVAPDGKSANLVQMDRSGNVVSSTPVAVPAAYLPKTTSTSHTQYIDVGGEKVPVQVGSSSTRGVSMPGGTASSTPAASKGGSTPRTPAPSLPPPPGAQAGGSQGAGKGALVKGLAPKQQMDAELKAGALDNTIDLVKNVQTNLPLLTNVITAKKIQFAADPTTGFIHGVINRAVPMTPQEAELAGNLQSLAEHINTLRGPLGATGFRGADAFKNLLAQGGSTMQSPQVVAKVLESTMKALQTQRGVYTKHGVANNLTPPPQAGGSSGGDQPKEVIDRAEYDALPSGAPYMQKGVLYHKR